MSEILDAIEKGLKKLNDFLEITPAEVHHSQPYNEPRGDISQVMTGRGTGFTPKTMGGWACTGEEARYINKIESPLRVKCGSLAPAYRNAEGYVH
jgi:hypothetical protein